MNLDITTITIQKMRRQCRLAMNGVASTSMRERGLRYKLNFGLMLSQIKGISSSYTPDKELAEALWAEGTRELKIMATMLYPLAAFSSDVADKWVREIPNQEIREQLCLNLLSQLPFAEDIALRWVQDADRDIRLTGYWLLGRLFITKKSEKVSVVDYYTHIWGDLTDKDLFVRNASLLILKYTGRNSQQVAEDILNKISEYKNSNDAIEAEIYDNLFFEFEYHSDSKQ